MERRQMIGGGLVAGLTSLATPRETGAAQGGDDRGIAEAIDRVRQMLEAQFQGCEIGPCAELAAIRQQQHAFLRANQKYPDFIEVGVGVWGRVYDWHVRQRQPLVTRRLPDGRYTMAFAFTSLLLRPEQTASYVGFGFDGDPLRTPGRRGATDHARGPGDRPIAVGRQPRPQT